MAYKAYIQLLRFNYDWWVWLRCIIFTWIFLHNTNYAKGKKCPLPEAILPCRCSIRDKEVQIWCSHSNLPQIMDGLKAIERNLKNTIDELVLENNQLPALPGRFFGNLRIIRLMLRHNNIERVSNGWLIELEDNLVEIYIVEPQLRSIPIESLNGMINMIAITIQSDDLKHLPDFSGLQSLTYLNVLSKSLNELHPQRFRRLAKLKTLRISGSINLIRLESNVFDSLPALESLDLSKNGLNWIHLRALTRLPKLTQLKLSHNQISDVGMIGRIVKDLENLEKLRLDHNIINIVEDGSFVDLPNLMELHLNDNRITELQYGAFLHIPMLKTIYLHNNRIQRIHPESFLQESGGGVEVMYIYNNEIEHVAELGKLLEALPALKFLDISNNYLMDIHFGILRGHGTLEQLHINNNLLRNIERDALMAMPALRELRLRNNSLNHELAMPFWNLPGLKGLDLSLNLLQRIDSYLLTGLPSLRRLDLSENGLSKIDPTTFIHNPMLETLNVSFNELVNIHPTTLRHLDRLFEVDASFNQLQHIIPGLPKIVERISLRGNQIRTLPMANSKVINLPNLRMLDLSLNRLDQIPKYGFQGLPQLRVLSLANNRLESLVDTIFIDCHRLELLHLQENQLIDIDDRLFRSLWELKNLNLRSNKIQAITDNLLSNNTKLEHLDMAHNSIKTVAPTAFAKLHSLEQLDLSNNALNNIPISLSNLINLRVIDLSYNQIMEIPADIVSNWRHVIEIRLSNNLLSAIKQATFRNLPKLQYLDLSSNEITQVDSGALRNLHDLQELVLADNKLTELKEHVFEDLSNLLAAHFQYNNLRRLSKESFFNSPSLVFLNLSNNHFHNMDFIDLANMRNLEVLDLSANKFKIISTIPLNTLNWLVELKVDNNRICKIRGLPFDTMPRLRVLSMRNNHLRTLRERTFRNLRGNIAIIDVEGNPIECSCDLQWLSVWLEETNFPYPGPKCRDGRLLRSTRIDKNICIEKSRRPETNIMYMEGDSVNHLPLLNDHGDVFQRELQEDDYNNDECDEFVMATGNKPLASDSEYFYDQYIDYTPSTLDVKVNQASDTPASSSQMESTNTFSNQPSRHPHNKLPSSTSSNPTHHSSKDPTHIDLNNTVLNTKYLVKHPSRRPGAGQATSSLTFFGYPLNSFNLNRFFSLNQRGRKNRGENGHVNKNSFFNEMPATHRIEQGISSQNPHKVRMYQPSSAEFEKYLKKKGTGDGGGGGLHTLQKSENFYPQSQRRYYEDGKGNKRFTSIASSSEEDIFDNNNLNEHLPIVFKTGFRIPPGSVEHGGFKPMMPEFTGGFKPVPDPSKRKGIVEVLPSTPFKTEQSYVPIISNEATTGPGTPTTTLISATKRFPPKKTIIDKYNISGKNFMNFRHEIELATSFKSDVTDRTTPAIPYQVMSIPNTNYIRTTLPSLTTTPTTTTTATTIASTSTTPLSTRETFYTETYDDEDLLETQSVDLAKSSGQSSHEETTTSETILLIPPSDELEEHLKKQATWLLTTTQSFEDQIQNEQLPYGNSTVSMPSNRNIDDTSSTKNTSHSPTPLPSRLGGGSGGTVRSSVTKLYTPSQTLNQYPELPEQQQKLQPFPSTVPIDETIERMDHHHRKDGMDWYYESFKKSQAYSPSSPQTLHSRSSSSLTRLSINALQSSLFICYLFLL